MDAALNLTLLCPLCLTLMNYQLRHHQCTLDNGSSFSVIFVGFTSIGLSASCYSQWLRILLV